MITDLIYMDEELEQKLRSLWAKEDEDKAIPSDLFYADTVPLRNFAISSPVARFEFTMYEKPIKYPVFQYYVDVFLEVAIIALDRDLKIVATIGGTKGTDFLNVVSTYSVVNGRKEDIRNVDANHAVNVAVMKAMGMWYGVQVALLHPMIKEVFSHPHVVKEKISKKDRKEYGNKVYRYVKHYVVNKDDLNRVLYGKGEFHRHALIWYVTGHWRTYKTGKMVFVQGYWKGALRETKKADVRERELVI